MSKIKDESYFVIHGWMLNRLKLKGTPLVVYAVIYGFSQDGQSEFTGSLQYLCDFTGASKRTIMRTLAELQESGLIKKREVFMNGIKFNCYSAIVTNDTPPDKMSPTPCQNVTTPRDKMSPNNIDNNKIEENNSIIGQADKPRKTYSERFERFWAAYPKKRAKGDAEKAFNRLKVNDTVLDNILTALQWQRESDQWTQNGGQYIPNPATYLNGRRWEDERPQATQKDDTYDFIGE